MSTAILKIMITLTLTGSIQCGKVLVFPHDGSHWVNMNILIQELYNRGHHVTVIRAADSWYIKEQSPYYHSITIDFSVGGMRLSSAPLSPDSSRFDEKEAYFRLNSVWTWSCQMCFLRCTGRCVKWSSI